MKFLTSELFRGSMSWEGKVGQTDVFHQGDTPDGNGVRGVNGVTVSSFRLQVPCGKMFKVGELPVIHENPDSQCGTLREIRLHPS